MACSLCLPRLWNIQGHSLSAWGDAGPVDVLFGLVNPPDKQPPCLARRLTGPLHDASKQSLSLDIESLIAKCESKRALADVYDASGIIGKGGFGRVWKVRHKLTGAAHSAKCVAKSGAHPEHVVKEIESLLKLDHPHVSRIFQWFESATSVYIVMELIKGADLWSYVRHKDSSTLFRQLMQAIAYCHAKCVAHRDLKMENCLVEERNERILKLIDFGFSASWQPSCPWMVDRLGTVFYMSPALVIGSRYSCKCDIWAAGIILFILLTGEHPFCKNPACASQEHVFQQVMNVDMRQEPLDQRRVSEHERELLAHMLRKDAEDRPAAEQVLCSFLHRKELAADIQPHLQKLLSRADVYSHKSKDYERALLRIVARRADDDDLAIERKVFKYINSNDDGWISREEMLEACNMAKFSREAACAIFNVIDRDLVGKIEYTQWLSATMSPSLIGSERALLDTFDFLDCDGSGKITTGNLNETFGQDAASRMLELWDANSDGALDLGDFRRILLHIAERRARLADRELFELGGGGTTLANKSWSIAKYVDSMF
eukprot:TRINITY_DN26146_c0_g2_i1.p1 TRINITY_DN26146_c0_g2~~TRINITY_DN26146_c0_g2_i1.p1  ORF type:complete len:546 (-),score=67.77 TRINITY_DN26146_c0_g2_i1:292-1929(-)